MSIDFHTVSMMSVREIGITEAEVVMDTVVRRLHRDESVVSVDSAMSGTAVLSFTVGGEGLSYEALLGQVRAVLESVLGDRFVLL